MILSLCSCISQGAAKSKYHTIPFGNEKKKYIAKGTIYIFPFSFERFSLYSSNKSAGPESSVFFPRKNYNTQTLRSCPLIRRDSKMAVHLSWRWIVMITYGDQLKASVSDEERARLGLPVQHQSTAHTGF